MQIIHFSVTRRQLSYCLLAVFTVAITTVIMVIIGRDTLGEAVIALLYLLPVAWSANRWGQLPGICAAVTAALAFDFLFIPPFYTFAVASLEGWLVLTIFLVVAIVVVGRIQASLTKAHEAVFLYELSSALAGQRTPDGVAQIAAEHLQQLFQASLVVILYQVDKYAEKVIAKIPADGIGQSRPDRIIPLQNSSSLVGEIQIWGREYMELPREDSRLLQSFASLTAQALDRTQQLETEKMRKGEPSPASANRN
jgi:K+-sensing histidine kinase KdpD